MGGRFCRVKGGEVKFRLAAGCRVQDQFLEVRGSESCLMSASYKDPCISDERMELLTISEP